jgi:transcription initiation factor TFIIIB Brf1 subunit/transcription initiation factor TFIIB
MIRDIKQITECPDCASSNIVHNLAREQVICRECGLIFEPLVPQIEEAFERTHRLGAGPAAKARKAKKPAKKKAKKRKR